MNFNDKYKERSPRDTINIIIDFFEKKNFKIVYSLRENDCSTWSAHVKLYKNKELYFYVNGKGINPDFALASGLGELYERFCGICSWYSDDMTRIAILKDTNKLFEEHLVEYKNINNGSVVKIDQRKLLLLQGSNGLAAGNNLFEAFNQAMSELCERYVMSGIINHKNTTLYSISLQKIRNSCLTSIIDKFNKNGTEIKVIDFGYTFKAPVVGLVAINKTMKRFVITYGCFPKFDIALERCLTEINQGVGFIEDFKNEDVQKPYKSNVINFNDIFRCTSSYFLNDDMLLENIIEDNPVSDVYIKEEATNANMYDYWKDYAEKNNIDVYYRDVSIDENMSAISLYSPIGKINYYYDENLYSQEDERVIAIKKYISMMVDSIIGKYDFKKYYISYINLLKYGDDDFNRIIDYLLFIDLMHGRYTKRVPLNDIGDTIGLVIKGEWDEKNMKNDLFFTDLDRFNILNKCMPNELSILKDITGYEYSKEDLINRKNSIYLLENIFYKRIWNYYKSETHRENVEIMKEMYEKN